MLDLLISNHECFYHSFLLLKCSSHFHYIIQIICQSFHSICKRSQTWVNDYLQIATTCLQQPIFWGSVFHIYCVKLPLKNDQLSTTATILGFQRWSLYSSLSVVAILLHVFIMTFYTEFSGAVFYALACHCNVLWRWRRRFYRWRHWWARCSCRWQNDVSNVEEHRFDRRRAGSLQPENEIIQTWKIELWTNYLKLQSLSFWVSHLIAIFCQV